MLLTRYAATTLFGLSAICTAQSGLPSTAPLQKTTEQVYKNIQVLKGVPADQLVPAMQFITASLGVQCDFCHVENAFDKDEKKTKETARKMMRMLLSINRDNFEGQKKMTCYACHRGSRKPVATPVITEEPVPVAAETPDHGEENVTNLPSVDKIIDKYLQAMKGMQASSPLLETGTLTVGTAKFPVEVLTKGPDNRITTVHFPGGDSVTGFNRKGGWLSTPGRGVHEMSPSEVDAARLDASPQFGMNVKQVFKELRVQPEDKIDGRPTYVVLGIRDDQPAARLYFDQESGLLVRLLRYVDTPIGLNPAQVDYSDYRVQEGVEMPFRWTIARPGARFTIQIEHVQQDLRISDEKFVPPQGP